MPARIPVFVNSGGGTAAARGEALRDELKAAFVEAGLTIDLQLLHGSKIRAAVEAKTDAPLVVIGGGDGTLGCAAQAIVDHGKAALGILPLGTRNHLARELGIPMDIAGAVKVIAAGTKRRIDLARVNGHVFVNNASIGLYPLMVRERDKRDAPKWLASLPAARAALQRLRHHRLHIAMAGSAERVVTPMLFVGNNLYELEAGSVGKRAALDAGKLSVFAVAARSHAGLIAFGLRALVGRADPDRDFAAIGETASLTVSGASRHIDIALDGEVMRLAMPLKFGIEPGALEVIAPLSTK